MLLAARALGPRRDIDDALFAIRERGGGRTRIAAERSLLCAAADWLSMGRFGPGRGVPLADVAYEAPPNVTDLFELSNEATDRRRIYRIETGQSFLDLCIR